MPLDFSKQEPNYEILADSIYRQEGGAKAKKPYGILSVPVKDEAEARRVAVNTARNTYQRWIKAGTPGNYVDYLADRYVPTSDDPKGNVNWKKNVAAIYQQLLDKQVAPAPATSIFHEPLPKIQYNGLAHQYPFIPNQP